MALGGGGFTGFDPFRGFEVGQQLAGVNPVGIMVKNLLATLNERQQLQAKGSMELAQAKELESYKSDLSTERTTKFLGGLSGVVGGQGTKNRISTTIGPEGSSYTIKPPEPIPEGRAKVVGDTMTALERLNEITQAMEQRQFQTGPTSGRFITSGPFAPMANLYAQTVGTTDEIDFRDKTSRFLLASASAESGAARGFREISFIASSRPDPSRDRPDVFLQKAKTHREELRQNLRQMRDWLDSQGYEVPPTIDALLESSGVPAPTTEPDSDEADFLDAAYGP